MNTLIIAQVLGIVFVVLGLSMFFNKKNTISVMEELVRSKSFMWIGGFMALIMGVVIIEINNAGSSRLHLLVSIIGWLALIKGIFLLLFPNMAASFYEKVNKSSAFVLAGLIAFVLGLILLYKGFM